MKYLGIIIITQFFVVLSYGHPVKNSGKVSSIETENEPEMMETAEQYFQPAFVLKSMRSFNPDQPIKQRRPRKRTCQIDIEIIERSINARATYEEFLQIAPQCKDYVTK